ncbi:membrane-bound lytic murein transglycosylase MltF [Marinobacter fonticola]|uniref:membrane-bound lytic murein transglycosylase MltF n=1 Tax=Marinobacter fonticola TaxID=2603215 RepID=UPI0011E70B57|nr:membrane-bound lytic murein transglycosylase MltF [Marinobacter fonticola]
MVSLVGALTACSRPSTLEELRQEGVLHVIARPSPSVYYEGRDGPTGFEYELAKRFANELGVELRVREAEGNGQILSVLDQGYAHIGLAGLSGTVPATEAFKTVPTSLNVQSTLIYHRKAESATSAEDVGDRIIHAVANSNHIEPLTELTKKYPNLRWESHEGIDTAGILERVESGEFQVAVVDSTELALNHVFFPHIKKGFDLNKPQPIAWLFPAQQDDSLVKAARTFFNKMQSNGSLAQLKERFYGHLDRLNYVGARTFVYHVRNRLPTYELVFQSTAEQYQMDWRLLAAIGYQESHWRPNAVSPTGVRGMMMLTRNTAQYVGIDNRLDPIKSIDGGARYFQMVHDQIPDDIPEPDRTWFALASYNVGFGHLEDARRLTEDAGKDPHRWIDVKEFLPLLAQKEWYTKTRYGYARGHEPVVYVQNIRRYYDVLAWMKQPLPASEQLAQTPEFPNLDRDTRPIERTPAETLEIPQSLSIAPPTL